MAFISVYKMPAEGSYKKASSLWSFMDSQGWKESDERNV